MTLYPFVNIVARSLSDENDIRAGQVNLMPRGFTLRTYEYVLSDPMFWTNYRNTVVYTVVATLISMIMTTCYAYVLSKKHLKGRKALIGIAVFTMFFSGGIIPNYVLITGIGLKDTIWAMVLPNAISVFNLLIMKSFFEGLPVELEEAAAIDGMSTYGILLRIVLPLSKAVIATMVLFYAVAFWNSLVHRLPLHEPVRPLPGDRLPAQPDRRRHHRDIRRRRRQRPDGGGQHQVGDDGAHRHSHPGVYPFVQRYFVSGVMLGAVKG